MEKITRKYEISVDFSKNGDGVPYTYEELVKFSETFPDMIIGYSKNKNETLFMLITDCKEII